MARNIRTAGYALALFCFSLSAVPQAMAQTPYKYKFCWASSNSPNHVYITRIFVLGPSSPPGWLPAYLKNYIQGTRHVMMRGDGECQARETAAEAESYRRQWMDDVNRAAPGLGTEINWIPDGATALSGPVEEETPAPAATATPKPPVAASAPAAPAAVQYDMWGKPIPTTAWWVCVTHMTKIAYATNPFFAGALGKDDTEIYAAFNDYLIKRFHEAGTSTCNKYTTEAEAEQDLARQAADAPRTGYKWVGIDWTYGSGPTAAAAPAPVAAPKPVVAAPAPAATAVVKPPAPAAVKPAPAIVSKPAVYVYCRSEWNTSMKRFYNPPVDGRGATYAEWQPSYLNYLQKNYGPVTNHACAKYPTREAAQKDFDEAVANARAQPTMNGLPSPIIITKWVY